MRLARLKGLSMARLARQLGVTRQAVHAWANGQIRLRYDLVVALARVLGLDRDAALLESGYLPEDIWAALRAQPGLCGLIREHARRRAE